MIAHAPRGPAASAGAAARPARRRAGRAKPAPMGLPRRRQGAAPRAGRRPDAATASSPRASRSAARGETLRGPPSFSPSFLPPSKVICYGSPVADAAQLAGLRAPVCGVYGANDAQFPPPLLDAFRGALEAAEVRARVFFT